MIRVLPFELAHMKLLDLTDADLARYGDGLKFIENNPLAEHGINFTGIKDGRILIVGGILQVSNHTGYGWTMVSKYAREYGSEVIRATKAHLNGMMTDMMIHRLETANLQDAEEHHRWCRLLGFQEEGPLWQYDDQGRDYIRFAKLMPRRIEGG